MHANGHTTVWGSHIGIGRSRDAKNCYQQLRDWWMAYKAAHHEAKIAALNSRWDAKHEAVTPLRADAAPEMAAAQGVFSIIGQLHGLAL